MSGFWKDTNAEGLALAKEGRWPEATRAFEDALAQLDAEDAQHGVTVVAHDDARAQLLLNAGQSYFHAGRLDEARRLAERSCAIRVSLYGEDALVVARTRGDLAVILGASGQPDDAMSLLERAVSAVEKKRGENSAHLLPLLTNAARLLERASPERARPFVARLNALLFAQKLADNAASITPTEMPLHSFGGNSADASDDHYLRSAIAETVNLIRTTPTANIATSDAARADRANVLPVPEVEPVETQREPAVPFAVEPAFDDVDIANEVNEVIVPLEDRPEEVSEAVALTPAETIDDTIFDLVEAPPPTLNTVPQSTDNAPVSPLGFEVQYGIPEQLHEPLVDPAPLPPLTPQSSQPMPSRSGVRAVGGVRRGSAQVVAPARLWYIGVALVAFGAGIGLTYLVMPMFR